MTKGGGDVAARGSGRDRPTLRTLAEMTGLSLSTVSLSLRGGGNLKEETKLKIAEAARAIGYVPDRAGVRLRTGKTNVIALVLDGQGDSIDFARRMIQGIGAGLQGSRYHLTVTPTFEPQGSLEAIRYILNSRAADGIIVTHTTPRDPRVQLLADHDLPFVSHGRTEFFTPHPWHDFDAESFVHLGLQRLAEGGCRKVMLFSADEATTHSQIIRRAFLQGLAAHGLTGRLVRPTEIDSAEIAPVRAFGLKLAASADRPDGILVDFETHALALASGLRDGGLRLGQEVRIVSKQTSDLLPSIFPMIDGVVEDVHAAGVELTRLLLRRIEGEASEALQTLALPRLRDADLPR